jgi:hypothetical protein
MYTCAPRLGPLRRMQLLKAYTLRRDYSVVVWARCTAFCQLEARVPEFDAVFIVHRTYEMLAFTYGQLAFRYEMLTFTYGPLAFTYEMLAFTYGQLAFTYEMLAFTYGPLAFTYEMLAFTYGPITFTNEMLTFTYGQLAFTYEMLAFTYGPLAFMYEMLAFTHGQLAFKYGPTTFTYGRKISRHIAKNIGGHRHRSQCRQYPISDIDICYPDIGDKYVGLKNVIPILVVFRYR